jgi:hypothetical protein
VADVSVFDWTCGRLQSATSLSDLEVRGTVRLALKQSGLDPRGVTAPEMAVVLRKVMPRELEQRAVASAAAVCDEIARGLGVQFAGGAADAGSSVEAVFRRLGGATQ